MSRYLKTLARCNISENRVVSIVGRLLSMQVSNAVVVYRLHQARKMNLLSGIEESHDRRSRGYCYFRHRLSQSETFGRFVRLLAREWVEKQQVSNLVGDEGNKNFIKLRLMFPRDAANRYNSGLPKARRLNSRTEHKKVSAETTYCVLCTWALRGTKGGKPKVRRKVSRQIQWCLTCRQAVCSICWNEWHTKENSKRAQPSPAEGRDFERSLRMRQRVS